MKISFRFENGTSQLMLVPENARDKQYLDLCVDGRPVIRLKPTTNDGVILEFSSSGEQKVQPQEPQGEIHD